MSVPDQMKRQQVIRTSVVAIEGGEGGDAHLQCACDMRGVIGFEVACHHDLGGPFDGLTGEANFDPSELADKGVKERESIVHPSLANTDSIPLQKIELTLRVEIKVVS